MKTVGSMRGISSRGRRTGKSTAPPPPPAPTIEPRAHASPLIVEEETYHLLVDAGLERRFREIHEAVTMMRPGSSETSFESRPEGPPYRIVLRCTHSV